MKRFITQSLNILMLLLMVFNYAHAQDAVKKDKPITLKHWMTPEEAKLSHLIGKDARATDPAEGPVTNLAEFDKMQSVLVRYSFGISYALIAEMSQKCRVTTIVANSSDQTYVTNQYSNQGVNLDNCEFILAPSDSYWTRDYGPWFVIDGNDELGIVDFTYNRPRPNDNAIPSKVANEYGFNLFEMDIETAGGNYMTDGMGISASSQLIWDENPGYTHDEIAQIFEDYLGIGMYHVVQDPNNTYIDHIDCWGKYLDVDKVLIRSVPESHPQYDELEATADYFASQNSSYGKPYQVFRVNTPNNEPYTNSLILNKRVFVPITNSQWDDDAIASYQEAMPGYEILGFTGSWESTDALHCRTKGIADQNMVHITHIPTEGEQPVLSSYDLEATIKTFSGAALNTDSVLIFYRVNGGEWMTEAMNNTSGQTWAGSISGVGQGSQVDYYLYAADQEGNHITHPFIGEPDPHIFIAGEQAFAHIDVTPGEISASAPVGETATETMQICNTGELDLNFEITSNTSVFGQVSTTVPDSPSASSYDYDTWEELNWTEFDVTDAGTLGGVLVSYDWESDDWPEEGSFHLMSPAGTETVIAAGSPTGNYSVDMTAFNDEEMSGTWRMWIEDTYGDGGHQATNIDVTFTYVISTINWISADPVSGTVAPGDCINISVTCDATELEAGMHEGTLMVASNDPDFPEVEIPVTFEVTELGYVTPLPDTMWVITWDEMYQMATITNNSNAAVEVEEIQEEGFSQFGWNTEQYSQTLPHTLHPGEDLTFWVFIWPGVFDNYSLVYDSVQIVTSVEDYYMTLAVNTDLLGSVNDPDQTNASIYPSPFTDHLTIDLSRMTEAVQSISITDLSGRIVKEFAAAEIISGQITWNINEVGIPVGQGVYLIQIQTSETTEIFKVLKMR